MTLSFDPEFVHPTPATKHAAKVIEDLENAVLNQAKVPENVHAAHNLLRIALLATAAVQRINEEMPWEFYDVSGRTEFWPILYNETVDLGAYRQLRIGHDRLNSRNPKKRGKNLLWAFFAKEIVAALEALRIRACCVDIEHPMIVPMATRLIRENQERNLAELHAEDRTPNLLRYQAMIRAFRPTWTASLATLEDFSEETCKKDPTGNRKDWVTEGERLFKDVFTRPERIPELRKLLGKTFKERLESEKRARIVAGIGRAIAGLANGVGKPL